MEIFVARQPIFDRRKNVIAYELLYRSGDINGFDNSDGDQATLTLLTNTFLNIGIDKLTDGKKAFVNFTHKLLMEDVPSKVSKEHMVIEILETVIPDEEIIKTCQKYKHQGYTIALDDFVFSPQYEKLLNVADIVKVDFLQTPIDECKRLIDKYGNTGIKFLAEKVETLEVFQKAMSMGYTYFQGYFFSKPVIIKGKDIPQNKLNSIRLLKCLQEEQPDFDHISLLIEQDISLSYKILKLINSAAYYLHTKVTSIKHALVLLGIDELKKWITLMTLRNMGDDKPDEIIRTSLIRAKFLELMSKQLNQQEKSSEAMLMGMLSMIDALMDRPLQEVLEELPLDDEIKNALLLKESEFTNVYMLVLSYERGNWDDFNKYSSMIGINILNIYEIYLKSVEWSNEIISIK